MPVRAYLGAKPGWQLMSVPRATVILEGSPQPGRPLHPWNFEPAAALAVSRTTVPAGKKAEQEPPPLPATRVQLIPAGCEDTVPLPIPPGMIEMLPFENWDSGRTVMIAKLVTPPETPMMMADWLLVSAAVETTKVALTAPAGTVTLAGTVAATVLSLDSATRNPPGAAGDVKATVPMTGFPPTMSVAFRLSEDNEGATAAVVEPVGADPTGASARAAEGAAMAPITARTTITRACWVLISVFPS